MKRIGSCACHCHGGAAGVNNGSETEAKAAAPCGDSNAFTRPCMATLHQMLLKHEWRGIQDAIKKDASVAMRIDDSLEEDLWFDEARRRKVMQVMGVNASSIIGIGNTTDAVDVQNSPQSQEEGTSSPQMQLRYWVGNQANCPNDYTIKAKRNMQLKRTLMHSLCRMHFPSNDALVVLLTHGDSEGLRSLMGAVRTAQMLINASHNCLISLDDGGHEGNNGESTTDTGVSSKCNDCPCYIYQNYCPPVPLPPVERQETRGSDGQTESQDDGHSEEINEIIKHTSVLTMTDAMGETPLQSLTGAGSCHVDLVKVFLEACRPVGETHDGNDDLRKPTVYDLLVAQNYHGCTPLHFLADAKNEEVLRLLLEKCQFDNTSDGRVHPTMICDNEGDLPLHFAACNGASPSLLHTLTTLGSAHSTLVRNSLDRLAIDDYIEWYMDREGMLEGESTSESESEDESDGSESSSESSNSAPIEKEPEVPLKNESHVRDIGSGSLVPFKFSSLSLVTPNWERELWDPMWVLVQAAATSILMHSGQQTDNEMQMQNDNSLYQTLKPSLPPIHTAVIATKYSNFPALVVHASILMSGNDKDSKNKVCRPLLEFDSNGYLPLHWACGDMYSVLRSNCSSNESSGDIASPRTGQCGMLSRFNTSGLACTMIEYLLHCEPDSAHMPTREGRLPLHLLAEDGNSSVIASKDSEFNKFRRQPWDDIKLLLKQYPEALETADAVNYLYPFQSAATPSPSSPSHNPCPTCSDQQSDLLSLEHTYRLIMEDPSLLCQILEK